MYDAETWDALVESSLQLMTRTDLISHSNNVHMGWLVSGLIWIRWQAQQEVTSSVWHTMLCSYMMHVQIFRYFTTCLTVSPLQSHSYIYSFTLSWVMAFVFGFYEVTNQRLSIHMHVYAFPPTHTIHMPHAYTIVDIISFIHSVCTFIECTHVCCGGTGGDDMTRKYL
jgi:hypothetical protein